MIIILLNIINNKMEITTDLSSFTIDELVEINKTRGLDYSTRSERYFSKGCIDTRVL
jgi:hypothetical protein